MEQNLHPAGHRIDPAQIRTLVQITSVACECEVTRLIGASVLPGDNVFDVVWKLAMFLGNSAVFAIRPGAFADKSPDCRIHL